MVTEPHHIDHLGIVVVYLVNEKDAGLLDLHLAKIREHTAVPYTIYGSVARLLPRFVSKLEAHPRLRICRYPPTEQRGFLEHAYYLDKLVDTAVDDGVSHVAILNVDSFPIRTGWAEEMARHLSPSCVVAGVKRAENFDNKPHPSGMLFRRDFTTAYRPTMALPDSIVATPACQSYLRGESVIHDTGVGYGYTIHTQGLDWHPLLRSNRGEDHYIIAGIYGDLIFHLGGAARSRKIHLPERRLVDERKRKRLVRFTSHLESNRFTRRLGAAVSRHLYPTAGRALDEAENAYAHARARLLADPDGYLGYLRTGGPKE